MKDNSNHSNTVIELIQNSADRFQDRRLYAFLNNQNDVSNSITYRQFADKVASVGGKFQSIGLKGKSVVLNYPNTMDFILAFFGSIFAGATPMPMSKPRGEKWTAVSNIVKNRHASVILTTDSRVSQLNNILNGDENLDVQIVGTDQYFRDNGFPASWSPPSICGEDIAFVQYTSGSTSQPKGVAISHKNVLENLKYIARNFGLSDQDTVVGWLPFTHDMGLIGHIFQPLYSGVTSYFISPLSFLAKPNLWLSAISKYKATISGGPNFGYELCCSKINAEDFDLSSWRHAYSGSERIVADTMGAFSKKFGKCGFQQSTFYPCYGIAEATLFVCGRYQINMEEESKYKKRYISVGEVGDEDVTIKIVDPSSINECPDGDIGEIWVKSGSVATGYYGNSEATQATFNNTLNGSAGYMRTGDLGFIRNNNLHFAGRLKNVVKIRGVTYHAEDIELAIKALSPKGVSRCAAVSINNGKFEELALFLENDGSMSASDMVSSKEMVNDHICRSLGVIPSITEIVNKNGLPLTTSGKVQREKCRELLCRHKIANA